MGSAACGWAISDTPVSDTPVSGAPISNGQCVDSPTVLLLRRTFGVLKEYLRSALNRAFGEAWGGFGVAFLLWCSFLAFFVETVFSRGRLARRLCYSVGPRGARGEVF